MDRFLLCSLTCFVITAHGLPQQQSSTIDSSNPNSADPSTIPTNDFSLPEPRSDEPFPNGIPTLPSVCDPSNPVEECFNAMDAQGAFLYFEDNHGCTADQQDKIKRGFWDAQDMLKYAARWSSDRSSRDIVSADYWMGSDWRDLSGRISGNLGRASGFINSADNKKSYITITCQDPKGYCNRGRVEGKVIGGYAWDVDWTFWTYGHINMCNPYYSLTDISGKIDDLNGYRRDGQRERLQDMRYYQTYGQFLAHEMMHLRSTYHPEPKIIDAYLNGGTGQFANDIRAYGPKFVHRLAKGDASGSSDQSGAKVSTINADSYALLMNSIFWWDVTQYFPGVPGKPSGSPPPGLPPPLVVMPRVSLGSVSGSISIQSVDDQLDQVFDSYTKDDGANSDDDGDGSVPATSTASTPAPTPAPDSNACHGISGDYWVMSRDVAIQNVKDFCAQSTSPVTYNADSVNELELSVQNSASGGSQSPLDAPDCVDRFTNAVIDGCDGDDPINNPHNYKFGATLTVPSDGWSYTMKPLSQQVNQVNCDVAYKFFFNGFEIRGKNFPDAKLGANGQGLLDNLRACGVVSEWYFEQTPDDCCFQWYASGRLPIGTRSCVGSALVNAGGSSAGNCQGAGKMRKGRSTTALKMFDAIDDWPGYGDEWRHEFRSANATVEP